MDRMDKYGSDAGEPRRRRSSGSGRSGRSHGAGRSGEGASGRSGRSGRGRHTSGGGLFASLIGSGSASGRSSRSAHADASARRRRGPSTRRAPRAIDRIEPDTEARETPREAQRRRRASGRMVDPKVRRLRRRRMTLTVLGVLLLAIVATAVGGFLWWRGLETKMHPVSSMDPELVKILGGTEPPPPGEPFFMILMGSDTRVNLGEKQQRSDTLIVARIDPKQKRVQMLSIPRDTRAEVPGAGLRKINSAAFFGGPKLVIKTVKQFTGLPIRYYVNVDFIGFRDVVDAMGGVWIDVPVEIDDRDASGWGVNYKKIKKGYQKLDGRHALTFVRARHQFADQDFSRMKNQQLFLKALAHQALQLSQVFNAPAIINAIASHMQTNMPTSKMAELIMQFRGMKPEDLETTTMPGVSAFIDGESFVEADESKLQEILDKMKSGERLEPAPSGGATGTVAPSSKYKPYQVPLTIRNGAGVSGVAKQCADFLTLKGFPIKESGNMNQFVYGKTLIVYRTGAREKANLVRGYLGFGDVIEAAGMYQFKTPVMVVIGKDWRDPAKTSTRRP